MIGRARIGSTAAATAESTATATTRAAGSAPKRSSCATRTTGQSICGFRLFAKSKTLAQSQIQRKPSRPGQVINRNPGIAGLWNYIERSEAVGHHISGNRIRAGK